MFSLLKLEFLQINSLTAAHLSRKQSNGFISNQTQNLFNIFID